MPHEDLDVEDELSIQLIKGGKKRHLLNFLNEKVIKKDKNGRNTKKD